MTPGAIGSLKKFSLRTHPVLYEINTWVWLEELSARLGRPIKVGDVPEGEWDSLAKLGFDAVWLMGVWQRSPESRRVALADPANPPQYDRALPGWKAEDVIGSPYAVAGYVPDARIGTWGELDRARESLHARGMALFLDFVGNHTALDHPWTRSNPEFYVQGTREDFEKDPANFYKLEAAKGTCFLALAKDPYFPAWKDVAQLNHFEPRMRAAQIADLRTIASHCDGVRCDMAMLQLNDIFSKVWEHLLKGAAPPAKEFWAEAHAAVPDLKLLAEAYWGTEPRLLDLGFSFVYDKELYDAVRDLRVWEVRERLNSAIQSQGRFAHFLENHDEARCSTVFGKQRLPSAVTLMGTLPGMRFYHQGELEGCQVRLPITLRIGAPQAPDPEIAGLFEKILRLTKEDVFHTGTWNLLPVRPERDETYKNLIVYEWRLGESWKLVVVNLAGGPSQGRVRFDDRPLDAKEYIFHDELDDARYPRNSEELRRDGLFVRKEGFQAHLFDVAPA